MPVKSDIDWEDAFANAAYIHDGMYYSELRRARAEAFRQSNPFELDAPYGASFRERFDFFSLKSNPKGLVIFIHGGFWIDFDKSSWSDLAQGALESGWSVAIPSYKLAPEIRISDITKQIAGFIVTVAPKTSGPIRLVGHSAGGHLATRMITRNTYLPFDILDRIDRVISISGLHDLRPLLHHSMNKTLQLDLDEAVKESPALLSPSHKAHIYAWVGELERPEFVRQSALLRENWNRKGANIRLIVEENRHHFDVIDGLKDIDHRLCQTLVRD